MIATLTSDDCEGSNPPAGSLPRFVVRSLAVYLSLEILPGDQLVTTSGS